MELGNVVVVVLALCACKTREVNVFLFLTTRDENGKMLKCKLEVTMEKSTADFSPRETFVNDVRLR